jgi:hypothetical protein
MNDVTRELARLALEDLYNEVVFEHYTGEVVENYFDVAGPPELTDDNRLICPVDVSEYSDEEFAENLGSDYRRGDPWVIDTFGLMTEYEDMPIWATNSAFPGRYLILDRDSPLARELFARGLVTDFKTGEPITEPPTKKGVAAD